MRPKTLALHHGYDKSAHQKTMALPIYQTTAYTFDDTRHGADLFDLKVLGNIYTRLMNPTTDVFEKRVAALEGGSGAVAVASGMAAIFYAIANVAEAGDNIVAAYQLYGGTLNQFTHILKKFGIEVRFFDVHTPGECEKLMDDKTKAIFFETLTNPSIDVPDIRVYAEMGDRHGVLTIVDNTVATPILCRPFESGIDISVHSASKYMTGQGLAIGGVVVERENIVQKLKDNKRYPSFNTPDESYHGLVMVQVPLPMIFTLRIRLVLLRDLGAALSPFNSWLFVQGLETLAIRMREHSSNAQKVAEFLESHPKVKSVNYPGLPSNKNYANAQKYLKDGCSGLLSFDVGEFEVAQKITDAAKIFSRVVNIGDSKSIITHPASTTHRQLASEELAKAGVTPGMIRLSVGLEDVEDLIDDLKAAME